MASRTSELIVTKVAPPMWLGDQIRRDSLLARLDEALDRRLTIIHAPAGYGKTSLLSQWRRRYEGTATQVAWLTLESEDGDRGRLAQYVALAIGGSDRSVAAPGDADTVSELPPRAALSAIVNDLRRKPRKLALILDDFHRAENVSNCDFIKAFIKLAPADVHVVVATRDYPRLDQSILAAEDQLLEFTADDLKFTTSEATAMLACANAAALGQEDVRALVERTEGWPIALQLTRLSLRRGMDHKELVQRFNGASPELGRYLSEQVLMTLPEETRDVVTRTALLDRLTGEAVNALCGRHDGWLVLERLERQGVLLSPADPDRSSYRYHQLFAQHLRDRLARSDAGLFKALHRRAAEWFVRQGDAAEALNHAVLADDHALVARMLEAAGGWRLIPAGLLVVVERSLARLPAALIAERPRLVLAKVYLEMKRGELADARIRYDRFLASFAGADFPAELSTEVRVVGDTLADYENAPVGLEDLTAREVLARTLPSSDHLVVGNICETLGAKYLEGGWLERSLEPTLLARGHYQALGSLYSDLFTRFLEARIKRAQGLAKEAAAILADARGLIRDRFGDRSDIAANCGAFEAEQLYEQGRTGEAAALLDWVLPHMEQSDGWVDVYAAAYGTAMRAAAAGGRLDEAQAIAHRARHLSRRRRFEQLELLVSLFELELLIHYRPCVDRARALAVEIGLDALADGMAGEQPRYRHVAVAAALCRARLRLCERDPASALAELLDLKRWAGEHGAGRLLIDTNILLAACHHDIGDATHTRDAFDEAVRLAMFQGLVRPFVDAARFSRRLAADAVAADAGTDRFRAQFLQGLGKAMENQPVAVTRKGPLNNAEAAILHHLSRGYSNKEIARLIGMSPDTVKYHLKSVFRKIGVNRRYDAVRVSTERGLIVGPDLPRAASAG